MVKILTENNYVEKRSFGLFVVLLWGFPFFAFLAYLCYYQFQKQNKKRDIHIPSLKNTGNLALSFKLFPDVLRDKEFKITLVLC